MYKTVQNKQIKVVSQVLVKEEVWSSLTGFNFNEYDVLKRNDLDYW